MSNLPPSSSPKIALALQGGGAHGAFTWGALDRLLEEGLQFSSVSGVSSGAIVATIAVQGLVRGGPQAARAALRKLWTRVAETNVMSMVSGTPLDWMWGWDKSIEMGNEWAMTGLTTALRMFDPGHLNPLSQNTLEPILNELLDRDALRDPAAARLFVGATDVETGDAKIFTNHEITVKHLLASSCLPMMFPAVEINGRHYWDGGYSCNPPLAPVLTPRPDQLILIRAQPRARKGVPTTTGDIVHRLHEIAFQAPLEAELTLLPRHTKLQEICADEALARHPLTSKMNTEKNFLETLFNAGREAASTCKVA